MLAPAAESRLSAVSKASATTLSVSSKSRPRGTPMRKPESGRWASARGSSLAMTASASAQSCTVRASGPIESSA